ncbi:MAG TPA: hypothetical protein VKB09_01935 [Thermomicrobiales bacterium]|nr:hypothetical protein [Thermomicrobiales bacterium]
MKSIEVGEFQDHIVEYLSGHEVLTIERDGKALGYYLPANVTPQPVRQNRALDQLGETVQRILDETGMTEDELVRRFDLSEPLEGLPRALRTPATHGSRG